MLAFLQKNPCEHVWQEMEPAPEYFPCSQGLQAELVLAAVARLYLPGEH